MSDESVQSNPLDELADEFVARYRRGERPALTEYCSRHPELADDIRRVFPTLVVMEQARPPETDTGPIADGLDAAARSMPAQLGDYRILREIARGGMGIVYEAEQESLGRHVALKVLPPQSVLDSRHLQRFHREARAAARLHHTNIVPVFGVGEHDGLHYYVMQFIHGLGLDQVLDELRRLRNGTAADNSPEPLASRRTKVLGLEISESDHAGEISAEQIAESLVSGEFPCSSPENLGIGFPPVKAIVKTDRREASPTTDRSAGEFRVRPPSSDGSGSGQNLLGRGTTSLSRPGLQYWQSVARVGVQVAEAIDYAFGQGVLHRDIKPSNLLLDTHGTVWVTDFGLAKSADSDDLTHTGDIVGTLRYLAPERLRGEVSLRGDLYSLGVTLYEMLTLRPPFSDHDRARLVRRIAEDEPSRPRVIEPDVPHDLETIVLKTIAKEPADRYETAGELAADLRQFLDDKPIAARPIGPIERAWRWCRRNPSIAGLAAAVAMLLVSAVVILSISNARIRDESSARKIALGEREAALAEKTAALRSLATSESLAQRRFYAAQMNLAGQAYERGQLARVLDLLGSLKPHPDEPDLRGFEWSYLWNEIHSGLHGSFTQRGGEIWCMAFSPDGTTLAVGGDDGNRGAVKLWDVATCKLRAELVDNEDTVHGAEFSPDGVFLAVGSAEGLVRVWRLADQTVTARVNLKRIVRSLRWSRDGRLIAAGCENGLVHVIDGTSFEVKESIQGIGGPVLGLAFSASGKRLASAAAWGDRGMRTVIHDVSTSPARLVCDMEKRFVTDASPVNNMVASYESGVLHVWDPESGTDHMRIAASAGWMNRVRFSPDGRRLATAGFDDRLATVWDSETAKPIVQYPHASAVQVVAFDPTQRFWASASIDGEVKIWHYDRPDYDATIEHESRIDWIFAAPLTGELILTGGFPAEARDLETGQLREVPAVRNIRAISNDGNVIITAAPDTDPQRSSTIQVWDARSGTIRLSWELPDAAPVFAECIALSVDGRLLATRSWGCPTRVWDLSSSEPREIHTLDPIDSRRLAFSPDGRILAGACQYGRVRLWDVESGEPLPHLLDRESGSGWAMSICFLSNGERVAAGNSSGIVRVWDVAAARLVATLKGHLGEVSDLVFFPDTRRLAVASGGSIRLWDIEVGQELLSLNTSHDGARLLAVSPDGRTLISRHASGQVRLWRSQAPP
jgi:WD40 repeat protein/serine/threonine protein kinase